MIFEVTIQVRVRSIDEGHKWYKKLLDRETDLIPHAGFIEWEIIQGTWLQVAEGMPCEDSGPIRFGVADIEAERERLVRELGIDKFDIHSREEVPAKWGTFKDPWGNQLGFFENLDKQSAGKDVSETIISDVN